MDTAARSDLQTGASASDHSAGTDTVLPIALSFVAGFVEAVCFVGLYYTFTAFITGSAMFLVIELLKPNGEYLTKLVVVVSFFIFTFAWAVMIRQLQRRARQLESILTALEAVLIAAFMVAGMALAPLESADAPATIIVAFVAVIAMSLHSTMFFMLLNKTPPTQFMTGNLTNFVVSAVDTAGLGKKADPSNPAETLLTRFKLWHYPTVFVLFFSGVAVGAWSFMNYGFVVLAVPSVVLLVISVVGRRRIDGG